jgi:serine/threonine protein kinase
MASVHQRYRILEKIDAGGMAEIYKAVSVSIDGFEKAVAIKRILPQMTQDQKFVTMFLDEARLSMQLNHANIVQILDLGKVGETYFMAMELVDGANLRKVIQKAIDAQVHIPVNVACFIAIEMAKGLAYAHEKTDAAGQSLGIVHRDVSPPNILLSRQGEVKVTDFGLAKAKSNVSVSETDVVKGKFAYLSPEVVDGKEPDARADIYAIGIILWEMLCGRRLFVAKTDMETVELVRKGEVPKSTALRADVDEDLDKILQRALAKNVKRRFQTCRELEQDLAGYLAKKGVRATSADLVAFLREMLDAQPAPEQLDVATLLTNEMHELARVGRLDLNIGQAPLRPTDLRAPSRSKLDIGALLDRVHADELDALAPAEGWAERLEPAHAMSGQFRAATAPAKTAARPKWLLPVVALGALAILAALAVLAWQATRR